MGAIVLPPHGGLAAFPTSRKPARELMRGHRRTTRNPKPISPYRVVAVMAEPRAGIATVMTPAEEKKEKTTQYVDKWFDRLAIHHLSQSVQSTTGIWNEKEGYESLIEAAASMARSFGAQKQQELVAEALKKAFPAAILGLIRTILPQSKFAREYFATFTTIFFPWLVGPCEVRESEFEGRREKNVVYIPKCRFLEASNCVGMCTNMCKIPSQKFIKDSLGTPVYMVPNFEDMSCEMIFGQHPPEDDPALKQPCYQKSCIAKQNHGVNCSS